MRSRDNFTRKLIHLVVDNSISGIREAGELSEKSICCSLPEIIVCDNSFAPQCPKLHAASKNSILEVKG